jgi:hypothetical protein
LKQLETNLVQKSSAKYICECCYYKTSRKSQYLRHLTTDKHKSSLNETIETDLEHKSSEKFQCLCGLSLGSRTTLWRHKKICKKEDTPIIDNSTKQILTTSDITNETIINILKQNNDLQQIILEQNKTIIELSKNNQINTNYTNSNNNSNNKTFNLQFFLNETCKDAMNITDFANSIRLQLSDLIKMGDVGYIEGISNIITSNLKSLDVTQIPIHCADKKREVIYVKDEDKWEKEDEEKKNVRKLIKKVSDKNTLMLFKFKEEHPDCIESDSRYSDQYNKLIIEAFGGKGDNDTDKEDKIIRNISKHVTIDKESAV